MENIHTKLKILGIHPLAVSLDARKTLPKGCESIVTIPEFYLTSPDNKKGQLQQKCQDRLPTSSFATVFFPWKMSGKKTDFPKMVVNNCDLQRV